MWTPTGRIFPLVDVTGVIKNLVDGYTSLVDNVVRTADIVIKLAIRPLHGFFKQIVTAQPRLQCIVNLAHWIQIYRRGYTVYKFVSLAMVYNFSYISLIIVVEELWWTSGGSRNCGGGQCTAVHESGQVRKD